jgi:hypothetical protein
MLGTSPAEITSGLKTQALDKPQRHQDTKAQERMPNLKRPLIPCVPLCLGVFVVRHTREFSRRLTSNKSDPTIDIQLLPKRDLIQLNHSPPSQRSFDSLSESDHKLLLTTPDESLPAPTTAHWRNRSDSACESCAESSPRSKKSFRYENVLVVVLEQRRRVFESCRNCQSQEHRPWLSRETSLPVHRCEYQCGLTMDRRYVRRNVESAMVNSGTHVLDHSKSHKDKDSSLPPA